MNHALLVMVHGIYVWVLFTGLFIIALVIAAARVGII